MIRSRDVYNKLFGHAEVDDAYLDMAKWADESIRVSNQARKRPVMFIIPMQGGLIVGAQVLRRLTEEATYQAVKVSLYDAANQAGERANFDYWPVTETQLETYDFIVVDDVAESLRTYQALFERLSVKSASVKLLVLIDKPVPHRAKGLRPDFATFKADKDAWLVGEGMNDGETVDGQMCRLVRGIWTKNT